MNNANQGIELSENELAAVQGAGFFDWVEENVFEPAMDFMRGGKPRPNVPVDPEKPFEYNPTNPGPKGRP